MEYLIEDFLIEDLAPMGNKKVAVIIGRFSPPTSGHYTIIDTVKKFIKNNPKLGLQITPAVIIIGNDVIDERHPLTVKDRELFMKASGRADGVIFFSAKNAFEGFANLRLKGYEPIAFAARVDRVDDYIKILDKYFLNNDKPIQHFKIVLDRDEESINANDSTLDSTLNNLKKSGSIDRNHVSGSLARRAVELGWEPEFTKIVGLESKPDLAKKLFTKMSKVLK